MNLVEHEFEDEEDVVELARVLPAQDLRMVVDQEMIDSLKIVPHFENVIFLASTSSTLP